MHNIILNAPVESGQFISLKDCGETPFVNGAMGRGLAVKNTSGRIISPSGGRVLTVYRNAISIASNSGINLFIQVGDNSFYEVCVKENQQINANQILAYFNVNKIVMFTVKNESDFGDITFQLGGQNYTLKPQDVSTTDRCVRLVQR
ncbi:MAG: PTS glucose transporter subunit IIA [Selenomonadaceae bacterium]|nr:PTS glucose transporter subunit IIA [Selenomonadaceae bacterium]